MEHDRRLSGRGLGRRILRRVPGGVRTILAVGVIGGLVLGFAAVGSAHKPVFLGKATAVGKAPAAGKAPKAGQAGKVGKARKAPKVPKAKKGEITVTGIVRQGVEANCLILEPVVAGVLPKPGIVEPMPMPDPDQPTEDAPAEDASAEEAPAEEAPAEEAPAADTPAEDVPVEQAPAEQDPGFVPPRQQTRTTYLLVGQGTTMKGKDGKNVLRIGAAVTVRGLPKANLATTCMQGTPLEVTYATAAVLPKPVKPADKPAAGQPVTAATTK